MLAFDLLSQSLDQTCNIDITPKKQKENNKLVGQTLSFIS